MREKQNTESFSSLKIKNHRLGSTRQIINTSGYVVRYYTYEPFGEVLEEDGTLTNYMMFTGQYYDTEIDQYYMHARQYDPHISRFTARDPVFGRLEEPLTLHRYLYCGNNPINYTDIDGEWAFSIGLSGSANFTLSDIGGSKLFRNALPKALGGIADMIQYYSVMMPLAVAISDQVGYGGTVGGAFVVAKDTSKGYVTGGGWSYGLMGYAAGGNSLNTGKGAALTIDIGFSWQAQHVTQLGGFFVEFGGSFTTPAPFLFFGINTAGFTVSRGQDEESGQFTGIDLWTLSLGWGTSSKGISAEGHGYVGHTWVKEL